MKPARDFWIHALPDGTRVIHFKHGGCHPATSVEVAMWDRLMSARLIQRRPLWFITRVANPSARAPEPRG